MPAKIYVLLIRAWSLVLGSLNPKPRHKIRQTLWFRLRYRVLLLKSFHCQRDSVYWFATNFKRLDFFLNLMSFILVKS